MATKNKNFIVKNGLTAQGGIQSDSDVDVTGDISATGTVTGATLSGSLAATNLTGNIDSDRITQINASKIVNLTADYDSAAVQGQIDSNFANDITIDGAVTVNHTSTSAPSLALTSTDSGSQASPILNLDKLSGSPANGDYLGQIKFRGKNSTNGTQLFAKITGKTSNVTNGSEEGLIEFNVSKAGAISPVKYRFTGDALKVLNGTDVTVESDGFFIADYNGNRSAVTIGKTGVNVDSDANITIGGNSALTTASTYVQSVTAGSGIKSIASASTPTVTVDSAFVTGLFSASEGVSYSNGVIGLDATDSVSFVNITSFGEINIFDSANGEEVAHLTGDPNQGLVIHSHAHATDGGIRFQIHNGADSDYLIISRPTGVSFVNRRVRDIADPIQDQDAATKSYVDGVTQGLSIRDPAKVATVTNLTNTNDITSYVYDSGAKGFGAKILITATIGLDSVDGYALQLNDRIIVKNETGANLPFNGVYTWDSAKGLTRATDMDSGSEFNGGEFIFVQEGTVNGGNGFSQKDNINLVGDSDIHFVQFSGAGQITAGLGIVKSGNTLDVDLSGTPGLEFFANQLQAKVDNSTIERVAGGLAIKDGGISIDKFLTTGGTGVTVDNILSNAGHTTDNISAAQIGTTNQFYNTTKGDSDTRALVDSAFVRPFARAAITAGANITYDSATGVIAGVAAYGDADVTALVNSDYVQDRADSAYIKTVTGIDAGTLGGQAIGAFLRSDATDAYTSGTLTFNTGTTLTAAAGATVNFSNTTGTAPFTVASTTNVPNLNASSLSGVASGSFLRSDTSDNYTSGTLTFDNGTTVAFNNTTVSTNAPFTVASTVKVDNLNADQLDGQHGSYYRIDILDSTGTVLNT